MQTPATEYAIDKLRRLVSALEKDEAHTEEFTESMAPESKGIDSDQWEVFEVGNSRSMIIRYQVHNREGYVTWR